MLVVKSENPTCPLSNFLTSSNTLMYLLLVLKSVIKLTYLYYYVIFQLAHLSLVVLTRFFVLLFLTVLLFLKIVILSALVYYLLKLSLRPILIRDDPLHMEKRKGKEKKDNRKRMEREGRGPLENWEGGEETH